MAAMVSTVRVEEAAPATPIAWSGGTARGFGPVLLGFVVIGELVLVFKPNVVAGFASELVVGFDVPSGRRCR